MENAFKFINLVHMENAFKFLNLFLHCKQFSYFIIYFKKK
jgi:hypothetical protein